MMAESAEHSFSMKKWLDEHVMPLLQDTGLKLYHPFWNGMPPKEVLAVVTSDPELDAWPTAVKKLLDGGFRFDFLREQQAIALDGMVFKAFGGDGAPLFNAEGMASVRLFRKASDGKGLILQVGCKYASGEDAAAATKRFYAQFEESPLTVCQTYGTQFGQA